MIAAPTVTPPHRTRSAVLPPLTLVLGGLVVRRWSASAGTTPPRLLTGLVVTLAVTAAVAHRTIGSWSPGREAMVAASSEVFLLATSVGTYFGAAAFGIFAARSRSLPRSLALLRTLPVPPATVDRAGVLPVLAVGGGFAVAVLPAVATVITRLTGRGAVHAVGLLGLLVVGGLATGQAVLGLVERLLQRPGGASLRLTVAYLAWAALLGLSLAAPSMLFQGDRGLEAIWLLAPLGWPLAWWALVDPTPAVVGGATAIVLGLVATSRHIGPRSATTWEATAAVRPTPAVRPIRFGGPLPVTRFEGRRLLRNARSLETVIVSGFCALAVIVAAAWMAHRTPSVIDPAVVGLLGSQVAAGGAVTSRGLSARHRPVEARLGIGAAPHVLALFAAALGLACLASLPALLAAAVSLPSGVAVAWLMALPLQVGLAVAVSVALTPESGNGAAEGFAVLAYAVLGTSVVAVLLGSGATGVGFGGVVLTMAMPAASVAVERAHRRAA